MADIKHTDLNRRARAAIEKAFDETIGDQFKAYYAGLSGLPTGGERADKERRLRDDHAFAFTLIHQSREDLLSLVDKIFP